MKIELKQKHIDDGIRKDCAKCPVALAVLEAIPEANAAHVGGTALTVWFDGLFDSYSTASFWKDVAEYDKGSGILTPRILDLGEPTRYRLRDDGVWEKP